MPPPPQLSYREWLLDALVAQGELEDDAVKLSEKSDRVITPAMERERRLWEQMRAVPEEQPKAKLSAPPLPSSRDALFGCQAKEQDLAGVRCLELQAGDPEDEDNKDRHCASGNCLQGARVRLALERHKSVRTCSRCRRVQLSEQNTDGLCRACRGGEPEATDRAPAAAAPRVEVPPAPAPRPPPAPSKPEPIEYRCEECGQLLPADADESLCTGCSAEDQKARAGELALEPVACGAPRGARLCTFPLKHPGNHSWDVQVERIHHATAEPVAAPQPKPEEIPMADCSVCSKPLRSDNTSGIHTACKKNKPAERASIAPGAQLVMPGAPAVSTLPDLTTVPSTYLVEAVGELRRRREELNKAMSALGLE